MIKAELHENMVKGESYLTILQNKSCGNAKNARFILKENERLLIVKCGYQGKYKKWRFGIAVDMSGFGFNMRRISEIIDIDQRTVYEMIQKYVDQASERYHPLQIRV